MLRLFCLVPLVVAALTLPTSAQADGSSSSAAMLYARARRVVLSGPSHTFAGTAVIVGTNPYRLLTVWHVAAQQGLHLKVGVKKCQIEDFSRIHEEAQRCADNPYIPDLFPATSQCRAAITILTAKAPDQKAFALRSAQLSFREPRVGEWLTAIGYPNGERAVLGVKVVGFRTMTLEREVVRYMLLAPADFDYFPQPMGGMSGGPVFDASGRIVGLVSIHLISRADARADLVGAVPTRSGLGRCASRVR